MYLSDVLKKEECRNEALQELRKLGIKCRPKKPKTHNVKAGFKCFKVPLGLMPTETVTLKTGQQIAVPKLVHELCSFVLAKVSAEGIFRKEGSRVRQGEMKLVLNGGGVLDRNLHVIDIAVLLKTFLRELPESLIPFTFHELFFRCIMSTPAQKAYALFLACLLLPLEHLNTLIYLMQFFHEVAEHSKKNKMNAYNLAVVIGPTIFPIEEKVSAQSVQVRTTKTCEIIQILIENAFEVGIIPENIIYNLGNSTTAVVSKKKKRRSGSLTRMFNGLKKIVGGKSEEGGPATPDLLITPLNNNKKRRLETNGISNRKKKELLNKLPDNVLLNTPFTPCRTPVSMDLSGRDPQRREVEDCVKEKKWFSRSKSVKNLAKIEPPKQLISKAINRRWSAVTESTTFKKLKKRNSFAVVPQITEPDYIRVPKDEYEEIKSRVSAMERRISMELDTVQISENENNTNLDVLNVQTVYEQTLQSNQLSPTTDQLAKRLSRDLKIRRSAEQKIIRSPSARKIGSMRRRSVEKNGARVARHQSWHSGARNSIPRVSLKRGKPNTVSTGLPDGDPKTLNENISCNASGSSSDTWTTAQGFFETDSSAIDKSSDRASIAELRSQNAGMVMAKAKLFDRIEAPQELSSPRKRVGTKIGAIRNNDSRLSYRVRTLRYEDRKVAKKSMSPRKKNHLSQKTKVQIAKYLDSSGEKENHVPKISRVASPVCTPSIKRSLNVRTPKRLCRTPVAERATPLKAATYRHV